PQASVFPSSHSQVGLRKREARRAAPRARSQEGTRPPGQHGGESGAILPPPRRLSQGPTCPFQRLRVKRREGPAPSVRCRVDLSRKKQRRPCHSRVPPRNKGAGGQSSGPFPRRSSEKRKRSPSAPPSSPP